MITMHSLSQRSVYRGQGVLEDGQGGGARCRCLGLTIGGITLTYCPTWYPLPDNAKLGEVI